MNRRTFFELVDLMRGPLQGSENTVGSSLSVEEKVAIAVYRLASASEYRVAGKGFGVSKSSVCQILHTFCIELIRTQSRRLLCWPSPEECVEIAGAFERKYCLPQVLGAIDGSHIPITAPREGAADFQNRKSFCSIVMQAVVDHRLLFRDVTAQHPGCNHDASVPRDSHLFRNNRRMFLERTRVIDGVQFGNNEATDVTLPYYLIGDPANPLRSWIMKDYPQEHIAEQTSFNLYRDKIRILVEQAFGRLKGRWRILCKRSDLDV